MFVHGGPPWLRVLHDGSLREYFETSPGRYRMPGLRLYKLYI
jgi:hypothetical protein